MYIPVMFCVYGDWVVQLALVLDHELRGIYQSTLEQCDDILLSTAVYNHTCICTVNYCTVHGIYTLCVVHFSMYMYTAIQNTHEQVFNLKCVCVCVMLMT